MALQLLGQRQKNFNYLLHARLARLRATTNGATVLSQLSHEVVVGVAVSLPFQGWVAQASYSLCHPGCHMQSVLARHLEDAVYELSRAHSYELPPPGHHIVARPPPCGVPPWRRLLPAPKPPMPAALAIAPPSNVALVQPLMDDGGGAPMQQWLLPSPHPAGLAAQADHAQVEALHQHDEQASTVETLHTSEDAG
eukprot:CAMPEP_0172909650 /NCGR_PEP_ID=MMETSP1075-20121228/183092_1 /TAXON_ID=2916 /ORGANISM="Ceratium fusus, Strain PA161109" /LENGTH=194 /DNA_ID=CAMNT_0013767655 /DNA_START=94 /DNA_END=679 /DNA_ORIENTATION=-